MKEFTAETQRRGGLISIFNIERSTLNVHRGFFVAGCLLVSVLFLASCGKPAPRLRVACKNFTEQLILGEIVAQRLEEKYHLPVERKFGFGSTPLIHQALASGEVDLYVEYMGTAEQAILQVSREPDLARALDRLREGYERKYAATWLTPLGFDNTYVFVAKKGGPADKTTVSELARTGNKLVAGLNAEFLERPDGYPAVRKAYGFRFKDAKNLDVGLIYSALELGSVDVVVAFSTDGRLTDPALVTLEDDRQCFPRYAAVPVARLDALQMWPKLRGALEELGGHFDAVTMRRLNHQMESEKRPAAAVAREFWRNAGF